MGSRSSTTTSVPAWALHDAQTLLWSGRNLITGGDDPAAYPLKDMDPALFAQLAPFTPDQQAGMDSIRGAAGEGGRLADIGTGQLQQTMAGQYLTPESNPYLEQTYNAAARGVTDQYRQAVAPGLMAQAQQAGVAGGSAAGEQDAYQRFQLGQNLSDLAAQIYGGNYQQERGRQIGAVAQIGDQQRAMQMPGQALLSTGTLQQGQEQSALDLAQQNASLAEEYPYKLLSYLGNVLGASTGSGGSVSAGTSK